MQCGRCPNAIALLGWEQSGHLVFLGQTYIEKLINSNIVKNRLASYFYYTTFFCLHIVMQCKSAEARGFEPLKGINPCWFSRPVHSTALPRLLLCLLNTAERVGFEPTKRCRLHAFQACSFSHSDTSPINQILFQKYAVNQL